MYMHNWFTLQYTFINKNNIVNKLYSNWILTILILFSALEMASFAILHKGDGAPD